MGDHPQDSRPQRLSREAGGSPAQGRDTIAAVATARGRSGIAVLRVSGTGVRDIVRRLLGGVPPPRRALLREFRDLHGKPVDRGIALFFPAPASYTGEDVLELQGHGGVAVTDALLECVLAAGARLAGPGEFTQRAFLEGRIDLTQAEAVADLIEATSAQAARAAQATLRGEFSRRVQILVEEITRLRVRLEAGFDFSDEGIEDADPLQMGRDLSALEERLERTVASARDGVRLGHGLRAVLVGAPNVGKSSILNRLAGEERAIVTPVAGTTRDSVRETLHIAGASVELVDTAGLRDSHDPVELAGIERAREQLAHADLVLLVVDDRNPAQGASLVSHVSVPVVEVHNKVDLSGSPPGAAGADRVRLSALTGEGFDDLVALIAERAGDAAGEGAFTARQCHVEGLREARARVAAAVGCLKDDAGLELVAEELRLAQECLGRITGRLHSDELLGQIFARFCIGK